MNKNTCISSVTQGGAFQNGAKSHSRCHGDVIRVILDWSRYLKFSIVSLHFKVGLWTDVGI